MTWILPHKAPEAARCGLYCLPYAGGGASAYFGWAPALGSDIEVLPVQPPGRENRLWEPAYNQLELLVGAVLGAIRANLDRPYALFGHSMGALVAFELAREIRRQTLPPPMRLFVCAKRAPHLPEQMPPLSTLSDHELLQALADRYGLAGGQLQRELLELMLPTTRADLAAVENYIYQDEPPFDFPITAVGGIHDAAVSATDMDAWAMHTSGGFSVHRLPAGHFFPESVQRQLCRILQSELLG